HRPADLEGAHVALPQPGPDSTCIDPDHRPELELTDGDRPPAQLGVAEELHVSLEAIEGEGADGGAATQAVAPGGVTLTAESPGVEGPVERAAVAGDVGQQPEGEHQPPVGGNGPLVKPQGRVHAPDVGLAPHRVSRAAEGDLVEHSPGGSELVVPGIETEAG